MSMESPEFAPLSQAVLDPNQLAALVRELNALTRIVHVKVKAAPGYSSGTSLPLHEAILLLEQGAVRAVQIHYRYEGALWIDSLKAMSEGIQLVRVRHEVDPSEHSE